MSGRSRLRSAARWTAIGLGVLVALLAALYGALQTGAVQQRLAAALAETLSRPGMTVTVGGLSGPLPQRVGLTDVAITDGQGTWLRIAALTVDWHPWALLDGRLQVTAVTAPTVTLSRLPTSPAGSTGEGGIPKLPLAVRLDRLSIGALHLGAAVLGEAATVAVEGSAAARAESTATTALSVRRVDGHAGRAAIKATLDFATRAVDLSVAVDEPPGGLIARAAELPGLPAVHLSVAGKGTLAAWKGRLEGRVEGLAALGADLTLSLGDRPRLRADGRLTVAQAPADWRPLLGDHADFTLDAALDPGAWRLDLAEARVTTAAVEATASGRLDLASLALQAKADLRLTDAAPLSALIAPAAVDGLNVQADVTGSARQPTVALTATADRLTVPQATAGPIRLQATVDAGKAPIALAGRATLDGLTVDPPAGRAVLGSYAVIGFDAGLDPASRAVAIRRLALDAGALHATASGSLLAAGPTADLAVDATLADLGRLSRSAGTDLSGEARLTGHLRLNGAGLTAQLAATTRRLSLGDARLDKLLGPSVTAAVDAARGADGAWTVSDAAVDGRHAHLAASATLPADLSSLAARYRLSVPDLKPVGALLGQPLAGRLSVAGTASGPLDDPDVDGLATATGLRVAGQDWTSVGLRFDGREVVSAPRLGVGLRAVGPRGEITGSAGLARRGDRVEIDPLRLDGAGLAVSGKGSLPLAGGPLRGRLQATAASLAALSAWTGIDLAGRAELTLALDDKNGRQAATAELTARGLAAGKGGPGVGDLTARLTGTDLLGKPTLALDATARKVTAAPANFETVTLRADGGLDDLGFTLSAAGDLYGRTELSGTGRVRHETGGDTALVLRRLQGVLAGQKLSLRQPATLRHGPAGDAVEGLSLSLADGGITADGRLTAQQVAAQVAVERLPLKLAGLVAPDLGIGGSLDASLQLSGPPDAVDGRFRIAAKSVTLASAPDQPPLGLTVDGSLGNGQLRATAEASGLDGLSAKVDGEMPVRLSAAPLGLDVPRDRPIRASARIVGDVATVWPYLPLDNQRLGGRIDADLQVGGSLAAPRLGGRATFTGGHYENLQTGTRLDAIAFKVEGDQTGLRLTEATATDGGSGRLQASGHFGFAGDSPIALALSFDKARLVRRDEVTAVASGKLSLSGTPTDMLLRGTITADDVEARLVDNLPPEVVDLPVTKTIGATGRAEKQAPPAAPSIVRLDLDLQAPRRIFVRGRGLDSEWGGALKVTGTAAEPRIEGRLSVVRGVFDFSGKQLTLGKGTVTFEDGAKPAPVLDVTADYSRSDFSAEIRVQGPASKPSFTLSSTPSLPRDEIISRILFGQGTAQLSALQALQLANAAASLSGVGSSGGILDKIRQALGVDVLRVDTGGQGGPTVSAGKYVTDRIYVGTKQGTTAGSTKATVDVELTPNISVESDIGQDAKGDVGLKWKYDY